MDAEPVAVTEGQATGGIDAAMHEGGRITGKVTVALGGAPVRGIEACALEPTGNGSPIECVETDSAGEYAITGLYGGSYKVEFSPTGLHCDCASENYRTQFYSGVGSWAEAEPIPVSVGATTSDIDARMVLMRTLTVSLAGGGSGTVTSSPGGIDCGATCSAEYGAGEEVARTATPAPGSTFAGFSGGGLRRHRHLPDHAFRDLAFAATFEPRRAAACREEAEAAGRPGLLPRRPRRRRSTQGPRGRTPGSPPPGSIPRRARPLSASRRSARPASGAG